jgi:TIR domain
MPIKRRPRAGYQVFFSCSDKDRFVARMCVKLIEEKSKRRIKTFLYDKNIDGGASITESIRRAIRDCDEFVVLLSPFSKDRPWVMNEIGAAWVLEKTIVAIIDKVNPNEMPDIVKQYKAIDLNSFESQYIVELLARSRRRRV